MIGRNITNHSLEKKKSALLRFIWQQNNFLSRVFSLKMDKFVLKVKPMEKPHTVALHHKKGLSNILGSSLQLTISYFVQLWCCCESPPKVNSWQAPFSCFTHQANGRILFEASETTDIEDFIQVENCSSRIESESLPWVDKGVCCCKHTAKQIRKFYNAWISIFSPV